MQMRVIINKKYTKIKSKDEDITFTTYDNIGLRMTKLVVNIPTNNYTLQLIPDTSFIRNSGIINWGDGDTTDLKTSISHKYAEAGLYEIEGQFVLGEGIEPTNSLKDTLQKVIELHIDHDNLYNAFRGCNKLVEFSHQNKINATNMMCMFTNCSSLKTADMTNIDTSGVTNISHMFNGCNMLEEIDFTGCDFSVVKKTVNSFNCPSLVTFHAPSNIRSSISFSQTILSTESLIDIIFNLDKVEQQKKLTLNNDLVSKLTDDHIFIIIGKNWSVDATSILILGRARLGSSKLTENPAECTLNISKLDYTVLG
jgi:hypothetical protein